MAPLIMRCSYIRLDLDMHLNRGWDQQHAYGLFGPSEDQLARRREFLKTRGEKHVDPAPEIIQSLFSKRASRLVHSVRLTAYPLYPSAIPAPWRRE